TFFQLMAGGSDIVIDHNTVLQGGNIITAAVSYSGGLASAPVPAASFVFTNNIVSYNLYGVFGDAGIGPGMPAISAYFPGASFVRNAVVGGLASNFPDDNYFPSTLAAVGFVDLAGYNYALAPGTPYVGAGSDGKDVGADFVAMAAAVSAVRSPASSPAPPPPAAPASSPPPWAPSAAGAQPVAWTNLVNVTANGSSVTKTLGCDGCYDAGAVSQQQITGASGYAQFTAGATGPLRLAGLAQSFSAASASSIAFGIRLQGATAEVRELGVYRTDV